jgi:DNA-binding response OmpR family regulator
MVKVLIAEDEPIIADMTEEILVARGYEVCGIARTVDEAVALGLRHKPDLAIIDLRLAKGGLGTDIANQLAPLDKLGVLYATGNVSQIMMTATEGDACIAKPYRADDLLRSLACRRNSRDWSGDTAVSSRFSYAAPFHPPTARDFGCMRCRIVAPYLH